MDTLGPMKCVLIRSFQGVNNTYLYEVETWSSVLIREVSLTLSNPTTPYGVIKVMVFPKAYGIHMGS